MRSCGQNLAGTPVIDPVNSVVLGFTLRGSYTITYFHAFAVIVVLVLLVVVWHQGSKLMATAVAGTASQAISAETHKAEVRACALASCNSTNCILQ